MVGNVSRYGRGDCWVREGLGNRLGLLMSETSLGFLGKPSSR